MLTTSGAAGGRWPALLIGIPQSLLYYKYHPMWARFLESLGHEIITSAPTSRKTVRAGTSLGENELCLPVKVFFGHCAELDGKCDALFVPRIVSVGRDRYTCPKFLALPDLVRALEFETPVIGTTVDMRKDRFGLFRGALTLGRELAATDAAIAVATAKALRSDRRWRKAQLAGDHLTRARADGAASGPTIGVAGHPYNIYDEHVSLDLIKRLDARGCRVLTPEMLTHHEIARATEDVPKPIFWSYENEVVGAIRHWVRHKMVDGIIYVLSFACGPDSFIQVLIEDEVREAGGAPLMSLVIDEHSGEAGMVTRVEAFLDMLERKSVAVSA